MFTNWSCAARALPPLVAMLALSACGPAPMPPAPANPPVTANVPVPAAAPELPDTHALDELQSQIQTIQATEVVAESVPAPTPPDAPQDTDTLTPAEVATVHAITATDALYYEVLTREIAALRMDLARLEGQMTVYLQDYVASLRQENLQLQREIQRLSMTSRGGGQGTSRPNVPMPSDMIAISGDSSWPKDDDAVMQPATDEVAADDDRDSVMAVVSQGDLNYALVKEWGRSPVEAARGTSDVPSLKGMIAAVPPETGEDALVELGRQLRVQFDDFENINISVFNDANAARSFAETNRSERDPVLSVIKYPGQGRDDILVQRGGQLVKIAGDGTALPATMPVTAQPTEETLPQLNPESNAPTESEPPADDEAEIQRRAQAVLDQLRGKPLMKSPPPDTSEPDVPLEPSDTTTPTETP